MNKQKILLVCISVVLLLMVIVSPALAARATSSWTPAYEGVWTATGSDTSPRLMRAYAIRVDLLNPWLDIFATPGNGSLPRETTRQTTPNFVSSNGLVAGINANYFDTSYPTYTNVLGLSLCDGSIASSATSTWPLQLYFNYDLEPYLLESSTNPSGMYMGVAGRELVLENGVIIGAHNAVNPQTAMGLSEDKRFLIMVVIDGRQSGYSMGVDDYEAGEWLQDFGAYTGAVFDGGGSSTICTASGGLLNSPSDGYARSVGANLGVDSLGFNPQVNGWAINYGTGQVISRSWSANDGWGSWTDRGAPSGTTAESVCVVSRGPGITDILVLGANNYVYQKSYNSGWGSWVSAGGPPSGVTLNSIDVCTSGIERMYMVAMGSNGILYRKTWTPSGWGSWVSHGGNFDTATRPSIVSWGIGRLDIFAKEGSNIKHKYFNGSGWSDWITRSGWPNYGTGIDSVSDKYGRIYVFYTAGTEHSLRVRTYTSSGTWSSETNLGGLLSGGPGACSHREGSVGVYCRDHNNGSVYYRYLSGGTWYGWSNLGNPDSSSTFSDIDGSSWSNDPGTHFP